MPVVLARWYRGRASSQSGALAGALRQRATEQRRAVGRTRSVQSLLTGLPRQVHAAGGSAALRRSEQHETWQNSRNEGDKNESQTFDSRDCPSRGPIVEFGTYCARPKALRVQFR